MFIVSTKEGKYYKEGELIQVSTAESKYLTWDDIPKEIKISQIQLTYPFKIELKATPEAEAKTVAPLLTIGKYDRYFFYNEAKVDILVMGEKPIQGGKTTLLAKVVGGIDNKLRMVFEVRLDRNGNCTNSRYPLKHLEARMKAGTFRKDIIRSGS